MEIQSWDKVQKISSVLKSLEVRCDHEKQVLVCRSEVIKMTSISHMHAMQPHNTKQVENL